jgi:hypothetical protein
MDAFEILVVVLSSVLALCLVLAVVALILFIMILKQLKKVSEKAVLVADNVEAASEFFKNTSMSGAAVKIMSNAFEFFKHKKSNKKSKKDK